MIIFKTYGSSSAGNCYTATDGKSTLMIEAGIKLKRLMEIGGPKVSDLDACLVTHFHGDHSKAAKDLAARSIDVYSTMETFIAIKAVGHRYHAIVPMQQFKIGPWTILPFPTIHDTAGSVGYLIENGGDKLLFLTDSHYCPYRFKGLGIIAIEINWSNRTMKKDLHPVVKRRLYKNHMSLERAIKFFKANDLSRVRQIYLLHLSDGNSDEQMFKSEIQKVTGLPVCVAGK